MNLLRRSAAALLGLFAFVSVSAAHAAPPDRPSEPIPDPGRALAGGDDSTAIAVNPANLAFLPGAELRWTFVSTGDASRVAARGHSFAFGFPLWSLATGLRLDLIDPPSAAPELLGDPSHWLRWALAIRGGNTVALGTTFGWGSSDTIALDGFFSVTSGITLRPFPWLAVSSVARDWNRPRSRLGNVIGRSYDMGIAVRPLGGRRALEVGLEGAYFDDSDAWVPRATLGLDVPSIGRLRGDITLRDLNKDGGPGIAAMAGLDINLDYAQLSGGGVFGDAITGAGAGFYAGMAIRDFSEPGLKLPSRVVKLRIDSTPGVRGHTRLLRKLWRLAADPEVDGIALVLRSEPADSLAHAEELGDALRNLRVHGKKVLCHLEDAGGRSLHVCSQADVVAMNPAGGLRFSGISSKHFYFGALLKKLGIRADFVRIGAHKLAAEQFAEQRASLVGKGDNQDLVDQINEAFLHDVGGGRRIPRGELARRIERGPFVAKEARESGLVDLLAYDDELGRVVDEMMGRASRLVEDRPSDSAPERWGDAPKVALIYLDGDMIDGESQSVPLVGIKVAGSYTVARALRRAREDRTVRAVVFRIETGGGSSLAADVILREAILTARAKPLIVSMGSTAASGGYYAAVGGGTIFANRSTITGSIGIFYGKVDVAGLLEKLGVGLESFRSAPRADAESIYRPFTDAEREVLGTKVKQFYDLFIARVAEGRHLSPDEVDAVARGRVWTGTQAHQRRLVDRLGGLREALAEARKLGSLPDDAPILSLPEEEPSLLGRLVDLAIPSGSAGVAGVAKATLPPVLLDAARALTPFFVFDSSRPLARMEFIDDITFGEPTTASDEARAGGGSALEEP